MPAFVPHDEWIKEKDPAEGGRPNLFAETMGETIQKRGCCTRDQMARLIDVMCKCQKYRFCFHILAPTAQKSTESTVLF